MASMNTTTEMTLRDKSVQFMDALRSLLDIIEELKPNDGQYLQACNDLKTLNETRITEVIKVFQNTQVVREHSRRENARERKKRVEMSEYEKLKKGAFRCVRCDRVVFDLETHEGNFICSKTYLSKKLSAKISRTEINRYIDIIHSIQVWACKTRRYKFGDFKKIGG
jgi:hypothetical protein